jgi:ubiquinone/menaquinone biosynthesis C-methylase UbiE
MSSAVTEFWSRRNAEAFDLSTKMSGRIKAIDAMAKIAKPYLLKQNTVSIDFGCGTGLFAETVGVRNLIGVDFSDSLLVAARKRMDTIWQQNIFDLQLPKHSVDNIVSLFVIDDYPSEKKRLFFRQVFSFLKPGGRFFFAAYSPNDERMGVLRKVVSRKTENSFEVYLQPASFYEKLLKDCGFTINQSKIFKTLGEFKTETQVISIRREFILIVAIRENGV